MEEKLLEQDKRDRLIAEWILRIASLERLLLDKGLITVEEVSEYMADSVIKMNDFLKLAQEDDNKQDGQESE